MTLLSRLTSTVQELEKTVFPVGIRHSYGGASTKIYAVVDAYGYPVYIVIREGQRNSINYAILVLENIIIENSSILAESG